MFFGSRVCESQIASGQLSTGRRIGRQVWMIAKRCFSNSSASSPIRSRTRFGAESSV